MLAKRLKTKWIKALRSGKYTQAEGALRKAARDDKGVVVSSFCCLGVLRELEPSFKADIGDGILHDSCGITSDVQMTLASYNDSGKSFKWIAANIARRKDV